MLFNSLPFIFGFFPVTVTGFFIIGHWSRHLAGLWLAGASLFFYGWWNATFVGLLVGSILFNFGAGYFISNELCKAGGNRPRRVFILAVSANLLLLAYFKYFLFFGEIVEDLFGGSPYFGDIFLPL